MRSQWDSPEWIQERLDGRDLRYAILLNKHFLSGIGRKQTDVIHIRGHDDQFVHTDGKAEVDLVLPFFWA